MVRFVVLGDLTENFPVFEPVKDLQRRLQALERWRNEEASRDRLFILTPSLNRMLISPQLHPHVLETLDLHQAVRLLTLQDLPPQDTLISRIRSALEERAAHRPEPPFPFHPFHRGTPNRPFSGFLPGRLRSNRFAPRPAATPESPSLEEIVQAMAEETEQWIIRQRRRSARSLEDAIPAVLGVEGPPGIGKSSWLIQLAHHLQERGWDVLYVDLRYLSDRGRLSFAERLAQAVARGLHIHLNEREIPSLARWIHETPGGGILILDGVERLVWKVPPWEIPGALGENRWHFIVAGRENTLRGFRGEAFPMQPPSLEDGISWYARLKEWDPQRAFEEWGAWFSRLGLQATPGWIQLAAEFYEHHGPQEREAFYTWVLKRRIRNALIHRGLWDESVLEPFFWSVLRALSVWLTPPLRFEQHEDELPIFEGVPWDETPLGNPALWDTPVDESGITPLGYLRGRVAAEEEARRLLRDLLVEIFLESGWLTLWWDNPWNTWEVRIRVESGTFAAFAGGAGASFWATLEDVGQLIQTWPIHRIRLPDWDPGIWVHSYLWALEQRGLLNPASLKTALFEFWWKKGNITWWPALAARVPRDWILEWLETTARVHPEAFPSRLLGILELFPDLKQSLPSLIAFASLPALHRNRNLSPRGMMSVGALLADFYAASAPELLRRFRDHPDVFLHILQEDFPEPVGFFHLREVVRVQPFQKEGGGEGSQDPDHEAFDLWLRMIRVQDRLTLKRLLVREKPRILRFLQNTRLRRAVLHALLDHAEKFPEEVLSFFQNHQNTLFHNAGFARDFGLWFQEAFKLRMLQGSPEDMVEFMTRLPHKKIARTHFLCALLPTALMFTQQRFFDPAVNKLWETWKKDLIPVIAFIRREGFSSLNREIRHALESRFPSLWKEISRGLSPERKHAIVSFVKRTFPPETVRDALPPSSTDASDSPEPWDTLLTEIEKHLLRIPFPLQTGNRSDADRRLERLLEELEELERSISGVSSSVRGPDFFQDESPRGAPPEHEDEGYQEVLQHIRKAEETFTAFEQEHPWREHDWLLRPPVEDIGTNEDSVDEKTRDRYRRALQIFERVFRFLEHRPELREELLPRFPFGEVRLLLRARSWVAGLSTSPPGAPARRTDSPVAEVPVHVQMLEDCAPAGVDEGTIIFVSPDRGKTRYGVWCVIASQENASSPGKEVILHIPGREKSLSSQEMEKIQDMLNRALREGRSLEDEASLSRFRLSLKILPVWSESGDPATMELSLEDPCVLSTLALAAATALQQVGGDIPPR